jgi:hypothetical protein
VQEQTKIDFGQSPVEVYCAQDKGTYRNMRWIPKNSRLSIFSASGEDNSPEVFNDKLGTLTALFPDGSTVCASGRPICIWNGQRMEWREAYMVAVVTPLLLKIEELVKMGAQVKKHFKVSSAIPCRVHWRQVTETLERLEDADDVLFGSVEKLKNAVKDKQRDAAVETRRMGYMGVCKQSKLLPFLSRYR